MSEVRRYFVGSVSYQGFAELDYNWGPEDCFQYKPTVDDEFVFSSDYDSLRLQLSRAKEFMRHDHGCSADIGEEYRCRCGLAEFLKEVRHE